MAVQFNDPQCRRADDLAHRCTDKYGAWWASPVRPARPGSACWVETLARVDDERRADRAALGHLAASSTLDELAQPYEAAPCADEQGYLNWIDGYGDIDYLESEEVR